MPVSIARDDRTRTRFISAPRVQSANSIPAFPGNRSYQRAVCFCLQRQSHVNNGRPEPARVKQNIRLGSFEWALGSLSARLCFSLFVHSWEGWEGEGGLDLARTPPPRNTELIMYNCLGFKQCTISHGEPDNFSPENRCRFTQSAVWDSHSAFVLLQVQILHPSELKIIKCQKHFTKLNVLPLSLHEVTALCVFDRVTEYGKVTQPIGSWRWCG